MKRILITLTFFFTAFAFVLPAHAASVSISAPGSVKPGEAFTISAILDPGNDEVNAIEGVLGIPAQFSISSVYERNSIVPLWIEQPTSSASSVRFSGIIPGGFRGVIVPRKDGYQPGNLFSIDLVAPLREGSYQWSFRDVRVLRNDGVGSEVSVSLPPLTLEVSHLAPKSQTADLRSDREPPDEFMPFVSRDPNTFGGNWFISFGAVDKGSGVRSYAVFESRVEKNLIEPNDWVPTASPYVLQDQSLKSYIYISAVDTAGNERVVRVAPNNVAPVSAMPFSVYWICAILLAITIASYMFTRSRMRS